MNRISHAALGAALASISFATAAAADFPEARRLHSIDVFQLEYADDVQISPDGNRIVYVRVSHDIMSDRARRNLWMVNADGTDNRPLRSEVRSFSSPRWSPDGTRVAYVSAAEGSPQLYVRWMDSGQTALLTNLVEPPDAIAWSPDGKSIAFTQLVPSNKEPLATPPPKPEGASWAPPVKVIDSVVYRADGAGYLEVGLSTCVHRVGRRRHAAPAHRGRLQSRWPAVIHSRWQTHRVLGQPRPGLGTRTAEHRSFSVDIATQKLTQLTSRDGPDNGPRGFARWRQDRLSGLRRPLPGLPGHSFICDGRRREEFARGDGAISTATWRIHAGRPTAAASISHYDEQRRAQARRGVPRRQGAHALPKGWAARTWAGRIPPAHSASRAMAAWPSRTTRPSGPPTWPPLRRAAARAC